MDSARRLVQRTPSVDTLGLPAHTNQSREVPLPAQHSEVSVFNIANVLTVLRIVLVPVFLGTLFFDGGHEPLWRTVSFVIFALAVVTDRVDGMLARRYDIITDFGKLADPIADKALIGAAFIGLSILGDVPWWMTITMLVRESTITLVRLVVAKNIVLPAGRGGKIKTAVQSLAVALFLLPHVPIITMLALVVLWGALVLTVGTGIDYVISIVRSMAQLSRTHHVRQ